MGPSPWVTARAAVTPPAVLGKPQLPWPQGMLVLGTVLAHRVATDLSLVLLR